MTTTRGALAAVVALTVTACASTAPNPQSQHPEPRCSRLYVATREAASSFDFVSEVARECERGSRDKGTGGRILSACLGCFVPSDATACCPFAYPYAVLLSASMVPAIFTIFLALPPEDSPYCPTDPAQADVQSGSAAGVDSIEEH